MAFIQLKSANPDFSFLIKKNPNNGMVFRGIRKGTAYGWYSDNDTYNIYFKDADNEISFKSYPDEQFEYLNLSRYNSPLLPLALINEFLGSLVKKDNEKDINGYEHILTVGMIHLQRIHYIEFFKKHFKEYTFEITKLEDKSYHLNISTNETLEKLIHVSSVLFLFFSMFGKEYLDIPDSMLKKYILSLQIVDAPFYIRNLFVQNFLNSKRRFKELKNEIENTGRYEINFDYGSTAYQRRNFIRSKMEFNKKIIDIGCGEGFYALNFSGNIEDDYIAIDINEDLLERVKKTALKKDISNIITYRSLDNYLEDYNNETADVILTEVIEHMPVKDAECLIKQIYKNINFEKFIITTPNRDFNQFYELDEEFRHDDHKWEFGQDEFKKWISEVLKNEHMEYIEIGDKVNGISTTQGVIIKKIRSLEEVKVK